MRQVMWREWAEAFPDADMVTHPIVLAIARSLASNRDFLKWMGHDHPVTMSLEPIAMIAVTVLCRMRIRYGKWDAKPVNVPVRPDRFDDTIGVPGMMDALWAGELIESVTPKSFWIKPSPGSFPKGYDEHLEGKAKERKQAALAQLRQSVLVGMASPVRSTTPEA